MALNHKGIVLVSAFGLLVFAGYMATFLGAELIARSHTGGIWV